MELILRTMDEFSIAIVIHWISQFTAAVLGITLLATAIRAALRYSNWSYYHPAKSLTILTLGGISCWALMSLAINPLFDIGWYGPVPNYPSTYFVQNYWKNYAAVLIVNLMICLHPSIKQKRLILLPFVLLTSILAASWTLKIYEFICLWWKSVLAYYSKPNPGLLDILSLLVSKTSPALSVGPLLGVMLPGWLLIFAMISPFLAQPYIVELSFRIRSNKDRRNREVSH